MEVVGILIYYTYNSIYPLIQLDDRCTHYNSLHGLRTPNEGTNQRNLKFWADVADKICFGRTYKFGIGIWFSAVQWRRFPHRASVVRGYDWKHAFTTFLTEEFWFFLIEATLKRFVSIFNQRIWTSLGDIILYHGGLRASNLGQRHINVTTSSDIIFYNRWLKNSDVVCFSNWNSPIEVEKYVPK